MIREFILSILFVASILGLTTNAYTQDSIMVLSGKGNITHINRGEVEYSCDEGIGDCISLCIVFDNLYSDLVPYLTMSGVAYIKNFNRRWERGVIFTAIVNPEYGPEDTPTTYFTFRGSTAQMTLVDYAPESHVFRLQSIKNGLSGNFIVSPGEEYCN